MDTTTRTGCKEEYVPAMKTQNKFMILAGLCLFIIVIIGSWSLHYVMTAVSSLTTEIEQSSRELSTIEAVTAELATLSANIHQFIPDRDDRRREACEVSRAAVHRMLDNLISQDSDPVGLSLPASLHGSFGAMEKTMDRIFSLQDPAGRDRESARSLLLETVRLIAFMNTDIGAFRKSKIDARVMQIADRVRALQARVVLVAVMTLLIAAVLVLGSANFIRRATSARLHKLREAAGEFGRGNLGYRLRVEGTDDISLIAEQLNGMADSLQLSRTEHENKLFESSKALAALGRMGIDIRHEINNPLTTVIGNVELLIERYEHKDKDLTARLELVLKNALRIADITRRLQDIKKENIVDHRIEDKTKDGTES